MSLTDIQREMMEVLKELVRLDEESNLCADDGSSVVLLIDTAKRLISKVEGSNAWEGVPLSVLNELRKQAEGK
jgi:hypothetical protein